MRAAMRPYTGDDDLRAMQDLTGRVWSFAAPHHLGDLAWGRFMYPRDAADWPIVLWESGGRVVAWAWGRLPDDLRLQVDPGFPELVDEALEWLGKLGGDGELLVLDRETGLREALSRHGFRERKDAPYFAYHSRSLEGLPPVFLPEGLRVRAVADGEQDLRRRVAVHQAAWGSRKVTEESYRAVMAAWPYRHGLDWVVEDDDGLFLASCLIWHDEVNGVGLIEPVGTHPDHRRLGLSRAVCTAALYALKEHGAHTAIVCPRGDSAYPVPQRLYRALGFTQYARTLTYVLSP